MVELSRTQRNKGPVLVVVNCFSKITHFVPGNKAFNSMNVVDFYFQEIVRLHDIPLTIISD